MATKAGVKNAFTFRHFAHYLFTEETDMMAEWSPVRISDKSPDTFNKNVLKYILTGIDGSNVIEVASVEAQKGATAGKLELLREMMGLAERELERRFPDHAELTYQVESLDATLSNLADERQSRQRTIDNLRRQRRHAYDSAMAADERRNEVVVMLGRFQSLSEIYESDLSRLEALEEGGAALLAGAKRDCPLCGADPTHQTHSHGMKEIEATRVAARAEINKIMSERRDLLGTIASLRADKEGLLRISERCEANVRVCDAKLEEILPLEAKSEGEYDKIHQLRSFAQEGIAIRERLADFRERIAQIERLKPSKPVADVLEVGIGGTVGHSLAKTIQAVLRAWKFPGEPDVSFDPKIHDILLNGKARNSNGKGVRALMNAAFKIGVLHHCRANGLPHPGILVLDSPLLSYRDPVKSRHGDLSNDERSVREAGVHVNFYNYLLAEAERTQFVVLENFAPPLDLGPDALVTAFAGATGDGPRKGLF